MIQKGELMRQYEGIKKRGQTFAYRFLRPSTAYPSDKLSEPTPKRERFHFIFDGFEIVEVSRIKIKAKRFYVCLSAPRAVGG
jgi:hypothetical protein